METPRARPDGTIWFADLADKKPDEQARAMRDVGIAKQIGEHLERHYRGHFFRVIVDSQGGIIRIAHPLLPAAWGYIVKLHDFNSDPGMKCITRAGGELLERFLLRRGRRDRDEWREASRRHHFTKHNIFPYEVNWKTGVARRVLPDELRK